MDGDIFALNSLYCARYFRGFSKEICEQIVDSVGISTPIPSEIDYKRTRLPYEFHRRIDRAFGIRHVGKPAKRDIPDISRQTRAGIVPVCDVPEETLLSRKLS